MNNKNEIFIPCECLTEGLFVQKDFEFGTYNISIFSSKYRRNKIPFVTKINLIWSILFKNTFFKDDIILSRGKILKLIKFLEQTKL